MLKRDIHTCYWRLLPLFWLNAWLVQSAELIKPDATTFVSSHKVAAFIRPVSYLYYEFVEEESVSVLYIQDHKTMCSFTILLKKNPNKKNKQKNPTTPPLTLCRIAIVSDIMQYRYDFIALAAIVSLINNLMSS